ncbi:hypothetical protein C1646_776155 [Rhizophagus diaphanus]|nr:hypothetical protein C1646_776155 [Rhizophagus diaphanus] [Rhizophagus sp. MUCL 43196]
MSSELESLKQRITELEAKNDKLEAENAELKKENTEIRDLRIKLSVSDAEIAELKRRNVETLRSNAEYNERLEQKQTLNDNTPNDNTPNKNSSNFALAPSANSGVAHHEKPLEEKEMDSFLLEAHKKIVSSEIKQRNKEKKLSKAEQASFNQDRESDTRCSTSGKIPEPGPPVKIAIGRKVQKISYN